MTASYTFRTMSTADLPMIRRWLGEAHVRDWWGDPDEQFALMSGDLIEPAMDSSSCWPAPTRSAIFNAIA